MQVLSVDEVRLVGRASNGVRTKEREVGREGGGGCGGGVGRAETRGRDGLLPLREHGVGQGRERDKAKIAGRAGISTRNLLQLRGWQRREAQDSLQILSLPLDLRGM